MRKLALDIGDVRIGIATSDPLSIIASGYETFKRTSNYQKDLQYIVNLCNEKEVDTIILGMPYNMDGTEGERALKTRQFMSDLQQITNIKIDLQDERLTTVEAERLLIEGGVRRDKRKKVIDKVAASIILQDYLNRY